VLNGTVPLPPKGGGRLNTHCIGRRRPARTASLHQYARKVVTGLDLPSPRVMAALARPAKSDVHPPWGVVTSITGNSDVNRQPRPTTGLRVPLPKFPLLGSRAPRQRGAPAAALRQGLRAAVAGTVRLSHTVATPTPDRHSGDPSHTSPFACANWQPPCMTRYSDDARCRYDAVALRRFRPRCRGPLRGRHTGLPP
jgi:hypothetical protein